MHGRLDAPAVLTVALLETPKPCGGGDDGDGIPGSGRFLGKPQGNVVDIPGFTVSCRAFVHGSGQELLQFTAPCPSSRVNR